jgi:hypothetical protein
VADVHGDGKPDLIVAHASSNTVSVLLGNGDGTFRGAQSYATGLTPFAVSVADVNGDGKLDLLVANANSASVSVLLGNGDGTFQHQLTFGTDPSPNSLAVADVNEDGRPDILVTNSPSGTVGLLVDNVNGTFTGQVAVGSLANRYVAQLYQDVLQRPADAAGLLAAGGALNAATTTPAQLAAFFVNSTEFRTLEVSNAYQTILGRPADAGLSFWVNFLGSGHTLLQLETAFYGSTEFFNHVGGTNDRFVQALYQDVLQRPEDAGAQNFVQALSQGVSPGTVAAAILGSAEADTLLVQGLYQTYLHRPADTAGLQSHVNALLQGQTYEQQFASFVASGEYQQLTGGELNQTYVARLYQDLLGRPADSGGLAFFTGLLDTGGATRAQVVQMFLSSSEYRALVVNRLYEKYLNRSADAAGLSGNVTALSQGATDEQVALALLASPEFFADAGSTNTGFVQALYQDILHRTPGPTEVANWLTVLHGGVSRAAVAGAILGSGEYHQFVVEQYFQDFLGRPADSAGLASLAGALNAGQADESVLAQFVTSAEYFARA